MIPERELDGGRGEAPRTREEESDGRCGEAPAR
jgi:hypothetical protein